MSTVWTNAVWLADVTPPSRKLVALAVADCHNVSRNQCNPGIEYIAEKCGMSEGQVRRHLVDLCQQGMFHRVRTRRSDGSLGVYVYELGPETVCTDASTTAHPRASQARTEARHQRAPMRGQEEPEVESEKEPRFSPGSGFIADFEPTTQERFTAKPPTDIRDRIRKQKQDA